MNFAFTEDQEALREQAREFLARNSGSEDVRRAMESEAGYDAGLWKRIGAELGWTGLCVPEAYGGVGLGPVELTALMECMGGALLCAPFFSTQCLALPALLEAAGDAQKREHLPALAEGSATAALAFAEPDGRSEPAQITTVYRAAAGGGVTLHGVKRHVVDGHTADLLVVAARRESSRDEDGIELFLARGDAAGLQRRALPTMDLTRRLAELRFEGVRAERLGDAEGAGAAALERALDRARVALAAEQVGGAQRVLELSVEYAKQRVQFGRPIGSFQAIKHQCADMMLRVEAARSAAYYAACVAAEGGDLPVAASLASAYCGDAYFQCAGDAIQIHGGVGFTWEYDPHLYFKRARASRALLGEPAWHRERVARSLGL